MPIEESAVAAQIFLRLLMALFALGVFGGIITNALILWRTKSLVTLPGEESLSRWERKGRQSSRSSTFFTDIRFKRLRLAMFASLGLCVSSFALLILIDGLSR
jgi:hypothetical protein